MSEQDFRPVDPENTPADQTAAPRGPETPEEDAAEQLREVVGGDGDTPTDVPYDVDPADATDQRREIELDEDNYR